MIADRFVLQQAWWVLSELVRRHPALWLDHTLDAVEGPALVAQSLEPQLAVIATLHTGIEVHGADEPLSIPWPRVFASTHPHEIVKRIEQRTRLGVPGSTPATTGTSLVYRLAARFLALRLDDRHDWNLVPIQVGPAIVQLSQHHEHPLVTGFPTVAAALADTLLGVQRELAEIAPGLPAAVDPSPTLWALLRDATAVAVLETNGYLHGRDGSATDGMRLYRDHGRDLDVPLGALCRIAAD